MKEVFDGVLVLEQPIDRHLKQWISVRIEWAQYNGMHNNQPPGPNKNNNKPLTPTAVRMPLQDSIIAVACFDNSGITRFSSFFSFVCVVHRWT